MASFENAPKLEKIINEWRNENEKGYRELPYAKIIEKIYGDNSVFYVGENYRSMYHDDYCTLYYYCNVTGEFFEDEWTSACACPNYYTYKECKKYKDAQEEGLIDIKIYNENWKCDPKFILNYNDSNYGAEIFYKHFSQFAPVEVIKGRKVKKGTRGIWFDTYSIPAYFSWQGNETLAVILTEDGDIVKVNPGYLKLQDSFLTNVYTYLNEKIAEEMKVNDRQREFDIHINIMNFVNDVYGNTLKEANEKYYKAYQEEQRKLYYPSEKLIAWVKEKFPHLNDEEVIEKGILINKKHNNRNRI